jgi:hypothetical protein
MKINLIILFVILVGCNVSSKRATSKTFSENTYEFSYSIENQMAVFFSYWVEWVKNSGGDKLRTCNLLVGWGSL